MPKKDLVRKKLAERHSWDVKSRSNVPQVKHASGNHKKGRAPKKSVEDNATGEQEHCIICMDTRKFKDREKILCGHSFHKNCINRWLQDAGTCPICRKSVKQPPDQHQTIVGQQPRLIQEQQPQQHRQMSHGQQELQLQSQQQLRHQEQRLRQHQQEIRQHQQVIRQHQEEIRQRQQQIREQRQHCRQQVQLQRHFRQIDVQLSRGQQERQQLQQIPTPPGRMGMRLETSSAVQVRLDGLRQNRQSLLQLPTIPGRLVLELETSSNMQMDCRLS